MSRWRTAGLLAAAGVALLEHPDVVTAHLRALIERVRRHAVAETPA